MSIFERNKLNCRYQKAAISFFWKSCWGFITFSLITKKQAIQTHTMNSGMLPNKPAFVVLSLVSISDYTKLSHFQPSFLKTSVLEWARKAFSGHMDDAESKVSHTTSPRTFPMCRLALLLSPATCSHHPWLASSCHHHEGLHTCTVTFRKLIQLKTAPERSGDLTAKGSQETLV